VPDYKKEYIVSSDKI